MANKKLFANGSSKLYDSTAVGTQSLKIPDANAINEAGGLAYAYEAEHKLAQFVSTGCFSNTFYVSKESQLDNVIGLAKLATPKFLAQCALYGRETAYMKDMPALLTAILMNRDKDLFAKVFPKVADYGRTLRTFVQIVRSGKTGRKSFGSMPKRLIKEWFATRTNDEIFRQSIGNDPSLCDIIKMVHPVPRDAEQEALFEYLIGGKSKVENLPVLVKEYEAYKKNGGTLPNVPFDMLSSLSLSEGEWKVLAKKSNFNQARAKLNTFERHGALKDARVVTYLAKKLSDPNEVAKVKVMPYELLAAYRAIEGNINIPREIKIAVQTALEHSLTNIPAMSGKIFVFVDVSGSMNDPVTGDQEEDKSKVHGKQHVTTVITCRDVAALFAAGIAKTSENVEIIPFSDRLYPDYKMNPNDSLTKIAQGLSSLESGATNCVLPLRELNRRNENGSLCVFLSDYESHLPSDLNAVLHPMVYRAGRRPTKPTEVMSEWETFRQRNPSAKMACVDLRPNLSTQAINRADILNVGGINSAVFKMIDAFHHGEFGGDYWLEEIKKIEV